ncbi:MAG: PilZ domain-containing protein [Lachnospiraceae bacterium]|nr:PilZ domain-containing protein [Lachnospiraceae bacterium]
MAGALLITSGTKMNIAYDVPMGTEPKFELISTFARSIDESAFLISVPLKGGRPLQADPSQKLLMRYNFGSEQHIIAGYVDDVVKEGIRKYWKIRRVQEQRRFFERADERYKVALRLEYMQDTWEPNEDGIIEKEEGMTLDISFGGLAMFLNRRFEVGETIFTTFPKVGTSDEGKLKTDIPGVVCWMREAPKGSAYKLVTGLKFRFGDDEEKEVFKDYVSYVKNRYRL